MAFVALQRKPRALLKFHGLLLNCWYSLITSTQTHKSACHFDCKPTHDKCLQSPGHFNTEDHIYIAPLAHHLAPLAHHLSVILLKNTTYSMPFHFPASCRHVSSTSTIISHDELTQNLENALETRNVEDAWAIFERLNKLRGLPERLILNRLLNVLSYSGDSKWLKRAYGLVFAVLHERKWDLLTRDSLTQLCLILARAQMPLQAATILRTMAEKRRFPSISMWKSIIGHMVKSENGTYLASEILVELCSLVLDAKLGKKKLAMTPDTRAFSIVLNACVSFGSVRKAKDIVELMPRVGVKADSNCFIIMAQIYEKTCCKEELNKLKSNIGQDPSMVGRQYQQFYSSLLTCHLNFGDLDAASELVLGMLQSAKPKLCKQSAAKQHKYSMVGIEIGYPQSNHASEVPSYEYLVNYENNMLSPNTKLFGILAKRYLESGKAAELAQFLIRVGLEVGLNLTENTGCTEVIDACIELGWLDHAHDMIDEMNSVGAPVCVGLYSSLLKAYCKARRPKDIAPVLKAIRRAGLQLDPSCLPTMVEANAEQKDVNDARDLIGEIREIKNTPSTNSSPILKTGLSNSILSNLKALLLEEVNKNERVIPRIYELNSAIQFFCKGHLMDDAEKAFRKMIKLGHQPNSQTFEDLISGYSAENNYQKIAFLWGDMKRMEYDSVGSGANAMKFDKELHDTLLCIFLRFGHFERSLELIARMEQQNMFVDKWKYKQVFLNFHRDLSMHRKPSRAQTEEQLRRTKYLVRFKQWAQV